MDESIKSLIIEISQKLLNLNWKLATAESCTGGGVAYYLTSLAGSSAWFDRGWVTYSNHAKTELLGVRAETLLQYGAVSKEVALEMANGALDNSNAQISLAVTGIAGPSGGTVEKPVGTVWFAWKSILGKHKSELYQLQGNRENIREIAIKISLENLLDLI